MSVDTEETRTETRPITVHVNNKPVVVPSKEVSGLQTKEAAVRAGVIPDVGFQLSEEHGHGELVHVRDDEIVHVNEHSRFLAVAPDDNS